MKRQLLLLSACAIASGVFAADVTWINSATDSYWTNSANWGAGVPTSSDFALFNTGGNGFNTIDLSHSTTATVTGLKFGQAATPSYTIGAGAVGSQDLIVTKNGYFDVYDLVVNDQIVNANLHFDSGSTSGDYKFNNYSTAADLILNGNFYRTGGTVILSGNNSYSGVTRLSAGGAFLQIDGDSSGATGSVIVDFGTLTGSGTIGGAVTVNANGFLAGTLTIDGATTVSGSLSPGNSPGTMTFNDDLTLESSSTLTLEFDTASSFDILMGDAANSLTVSNGASIVLDFTGGVFASNDTLSVFQNWGSLVDNGSSVSVIGTDAGNLDLSSLFSTGEVTVTAAIPEPAVISLIGFFGLGMLFLKRRFTK